MHLFYVPPLCTPLCASSMHLLYALDKNVKYSVIKLLLCIVLSLCLYLCVALPGPAHPPKGKYSLKTVIVSTSLLFFRNYTMAPKDVSYNVPDVLQGNDVGLQEYQLAIEYSLPIIPLAPAVAIEQFDVEAEIDELIEMQLSLQGK